MEYLAQNSLNFFGNRLDQSTVKLGSGAGPIFANVCNIRNDVLVTKVLPSMPIPPTDSVAQIGSPANKSLYSGVRIKRTIRNFITKWSINS